MMKDFVSFKERLSSDPAFLEKYKTLKNAAAIIAMAKEDGYEFTEEDLLQSTEVSEEELSGVAGGLAFGVGISGDYGSFGGIIG